MPTSGKIFTEKQRSLIAQKVATQEAEQQQDMELTEAFGKADNEDSECEEEYGDDDLQSTLLAANFFA